MKNLHVTGAVSGKIVNLGAGVLNFSMYNCVIDGELISGRHGFGSGTLEGNITVDGCEFKDVLGWALFETRSGSGGGGSPLGVINFTDNCVHNCNGTIVFRGDETGGEGVNYTPEVNILRNTWNTIGGNGSPVEQGLQWSTFEVNRAVKVTVSDNSIDGVIIGVDGLGQAAQMWNIDDLTVTNNYFKNTEQGIWIASVAGYNGLTTSGILSDNYFENVGSVGGGAFAPGVALVNATENNTLTGTCNWWNTTTPATIAGMVDGDVVVSPYRIGGTDGGAHLPGFDPTDACTGTYPVHNLTQVKDYATIQLAIDDAVAADVIAVDAGTYNENVNIYKQLEIRGAQYDVDARGRVVGAPNPAVESVIAPTSGPVINLLAGASLSTIDGFAMIGDFASGSKGIINSEATTLNNLTIQYNSMVVTSTVGHAFWFNNSAIDATIHKNEMVGGTSSTQVIFLDGGDQFHGLHITYNNILGTGGVYGIFVDGNRNVGTSGARTSLIQGNLFQIFWIFNT